MAIDVRGKRSTAGEMSRRALMQGAAWLGSGAAAIALLPGAVCNAQDGVETSASQWISTTRDRPWETRRALPIGYRWNTLDVEVQLTRSAQTIEGFGACFNELGWTSLQVLSANDRAAIFKELFAPAIGANLTLCRLPVGANDFSRNWYSYDEIAGDFLLEHFSIWNDAETLIPFVKSAQQQNPALRLWSSPWSPPTWMKRNHAYAEAMQRPGWPANGLTAAQVGREGEDMFIQEERYFAAYASYFGKYIDAYRSQGINIGTVMPQNEFNSAQAFPSCTWTPRGLANFIKHLGPVMSEREVSIFFGTLERGNISLLDAVMSDPAAARYISGVGMQWAGKLALASIRDKYPSLQLYQSEQECGDGQNNWEYCSYCWDLMKDYLKNGTRGYCYWNISLETGGISRWGWPQNSLITVDASSKGYHYNHEYYLLKHVSHFVLPGARRVETKGTFDDVLAFVNTDGSTAVVARNEGPFDKPLAIVVGKQQLTILMKPQSFNTILFQPAS